MKDNHWENQYRRLELAWYDMRRAEGIARRIIDEGLYDTRQMSRSLERGALHTALVVTYARPFTQAKGYSKLPLDISKIFSQDLRELHSDMIVLRDKVYAHSDSDYIGVELSLENDELKASLSFPIFFLFGLPESALRDLMVAISIIQSKIREKQAFVSQLLLEQST